MSSQKPSVAKAAVSWFMAGLGFLVGFVCIVAVGQIYIHDEWIAPGLFLFFIASVLLIASFRSLYNRLSSGLIFFACAPIFFLGVVWLNGVPREYIASVCWTSPFLILGLFWIGTHKLRWPPLLIASNAPLKLKAAKTLAACLLLVVLDVVATLALAVWGSSSTSLGCNDRQLFNRPKHESHEVFVARMIHVGHARKVDGKWAGEWAIARIEEKFWGVPQWTPRFVLLRDGVFWEGETYLVEGYRSGRLLRHFLPIVEDVGLCGRTRPLAYAGTDLRVLRRSPSTNGVSILGYVLKSSSLDYLYLGPVLPPEPVIGAKVVLTSSSGRKTAYTDAAGIYEFDSLPLDDYDIGVEEKDGRIIKKPLGKGSFERSGLWEQNFVVAAQK